MDSFLSIIDLILILTKYLPGIIDVYGSDVPDPVVIICCETGLVYFRIFLGILLTVHRGALAGAAS